jgi:hypothetical protein
MDREPVKSNSKYNLLKAFISKVNGKPGKLLRTANSPAKFQSE